jgi:Sulfotransferase domain
VTDIAFLIIGAQKAGTTSLFEYMRRHPEIHMPPEKEVSFFNRRHDLGPSWYMETVLRNAPPGAVCGEASVGYMVGTPYGDIAKNALSDPRAGDPYPDPLESVIPRRIKELLPDVRLICVLRDPVARAYSHYQMTVLEGAESRPFDEAVEELLTHDALTRSRIAPTAVNGYIVNGEYFRLLAGFMEVFPRDQLLVVFSNELSTGGAATLARVFAFIDTSADFVPDNLDAHYRTAATKRRIPGFDLYAWQVSLARSRPLRALWHRLPAPVRVKADQGYRVAGYRVAMWNARRSKASQQMSAHARAALVEHFLPDSQALSRLTGLEIPWLADWQAT